MKLKVKYNWTIYFSLVASFIFTEIFRNIKHLPISKVYSLDYLVAIILNSTFILFFALSIQFDHTGEIDKKSRYTLLGMLFSLISGLIFIYQCYEYGFNIKLFVQAYYISITAAFGFFRLFKRSNVNNFANHESSKSQLFIAAIFFVFGLGLDFFIGFKFNFAYILSMIIFAATFFGQLLEVMGDKRMFYFWLIMDITGLVWGIIILNPDIIERYITFLTSSILACYVAVKLSKEIKWQQH